MTEQQTYNGWTNYETWNVALWIGNEQGSYNYWQDVTRECLESAEPELTREGSELFSRKEVAARGLAERLKDEITDGNPLSNQNSMYSDILSAALSEVNWGEIAGNWLDDLAD